MAEWELNSHLQNQTITDSTFHTHWDTWFNQTDVDQLVALKITSVRIPIGFWVIEGIVNRTSEHYAQGGLDMLISRLEMLKQAGIGVLLDHHALPGVAASYSMFAGHCTGDVEFYTEANYRRAITWTAVMTFLTHAHPSFSTVFSIEAANEPLSDASLTPNFSTFEAAFVLAIRTVEATFGIICDASIFTSPYLSTPFLIGGLEDAVPIIRDYSRNYNLDLSNAGNVSFAPLNQTIGALAGLVDSGSSPQCLATSSMDSSWQYAVNSTVEVGNPANYTRGPSLFDNHLYLAFGYVAPEATPKSYLTTICNNTRIAKAAAVGDSPLFFGEWSLGTEWSSSTDDFLRQFGDAQKLAFSKGAGWMFWSMKLNPDADSLGDWRGWSYFDAVKDGLFTADPNAVFDQHVCDPYI
ncbi:glucan endo-1,6-beta-glucosidase, partial [Phenoliferia sp. Uapishka_3]